MQTTMQLPELLCPAGNMARLDTALTYGADACYLGGKSMSLRASTAGFDWDELEIACQKAHTRNAKIYYTINVLPQEKHLSAVAESLEKLASSAVDGLIIADPGILRMARRYAPQKEVHLSTQANTANSEAVGFWYDLGIRRVNVAREVGKEGLLALRKAFPDMELEVFAHGAMCLALSGRCLLSSWLNQRPANLGECTHPCRFEYKGIGIENIALTVEEGSRNEEPMWQVTEEEGYSSFWAPHDLCLVQYTPWFVQNGIASLKIEGRMKTPGYVAHVTDVYRTALNDVANGKNQTEHYIAELRNTASRKLSTGFFLPEKKRTTIDPMKNDERRPIVAQVLEKLTETSWRVAVRSIWDSNNAVQIMMPGLKRPTLTAGSYSVENHKGEHAQILHSGTEAVLHCESNEIAPNYFLRA